MTNDLQGAITWCNPAPEPLTLEQLADIAKQLQTPARLYKFKLPKLDQELDLRDYELRGNIQIGFYLIRRDRIRRNGRKRLCCR